MSMSSTRPTLNTLGGNRTFTGAQFADGATLATLCAPYWAFSSFPTANRSLSWTRKTRRYARPWPRPDLGSTVSARRSRTGYLSRVRPRRKHANRVLAEGQSVPRGRT